MGIFLTEKQREELKYCHRMEDKLRYDDRIKAVLLLDSGWPSEEDIGSTFAEWEHDPKLPKSI